MIKRLLSLALMLCIILGVTMLVPVAAAPHYVAVQKGITLSPSIENITVLPTDTVKTYELGLTNNTTSLQELDLTTEDFGSLNNTGGILLEGSNTYTQKYGLVSWLTLENNTVILNPGESRNILVSIDNRSSLQPGGHYGAVVATVNSLGPQTGNSVSIHQQLLSLILVDKQGGDHYDLSLASLSQNGNWLHLPNDIILLFQNPGNVHVVPRGLVELESPNNTVIAQGIINTDSDFILPESFRQIEVPLTMVGHSLPLPGSYHLVVHYRYDGFRNYAVKTYNVHFIDLKLYAFGFLVLCTSIYLIRRDRRRAKKPPESTVTETFQKPKKANSIDPSDDQN